MKALSPSETAFIRATWTAAVSRDGAFPESPSDTAIEGAGILTASILIELPVYTAPLVPSMDTPNTHCALSPTTPESPGGVTRVRSACARAMSRAMSALSMRVLAEGNTFTPPMPTACEGAAVLVLACQVRELGSQGNEKKGVENEPDHLYT